MLPDGKTEQLAIKSGLIPPSQFDLRVKRVLDATVARPKSLLTQEQDLAWKAFASGRWNDEVVTILYPPRTKLDLGIRRTRLADSMRLLDTGTTKTVSVFTDLKDMIGQDYIFVQNKLNYYAICPEEIRRWYTKSNLFVADRDVFDTQMKKVSNAYKSSEVDKNYAWLTELSNLRGFRNLPVDDFDFEREVKELAGQGKRPQFTDFVKNNFTDAMEKVITFEPGSMYHGTSIEDFIFSGDWVTSGSSSEGKVMWADPRTGETGKFKAKKNLAFDVLDLNKLTLDMRTWDKQRHVAIIKNEPGKVRLAVASDLISYLQMSWLNSHMRGVYNRWQGATLEESATMQFARFREMLRLIIQTWNLPFDFEAFDHQPRRWMLKIMIYYLLNGCRRFVLPIYYADYDHVSTLVIRSFDNATIRFKDQTDGRTGEFAVVDNLMSGLRWTSLIGNMWNMIMTEVVNKLVAGRYIKRYVRGDDSALMFNSYSDALNFKIGYDKTGIWSNSSKFSITWGHSEFLRMRFTPQGIRGIIGRAVVGLSQRKPWSNEAWSYDAVTTDLLRAVGTIARRAQDYTLYLRLVSWVIQIWTRQRGLTKRWLELPISLGGLGLLPFNHYLPLGSNSYVKNTVKPFITLTNKKNTQREDNLNKEFVQLGFVLKPQQLEYLASEDVNKMFSLDDIPSLSKYNRSQIDIKSLKKVKFFKDFTKIIPDENLIAAQIIDTVIRQIKKFDPLYDELKVLIRYYEPSNVKQVNQALDKYRTLSRISKFGYKTPSLTEVIRSFSYTSYAELKNLELQLKCPRWLSVALLSGEQLIPNYFINSLLYNLYVVITNYTIRWIISKLNGFDSYRLAHYYVEQNIPASMSSCNYCQVLSNW